MTSPSIFDYTRTTLRNQILSVEHPMLFNLREFPPISGLPEGCVRIRIRADELTPIIYVRSATGIRKFLINIDVDNKLSCGPEVAANWRPSLRVPVDVTTDIPTPTPASELEAEAAAQLGANSTGTKWVWYIDCDGGWQVKPADILSFVQLNDIVLGGEIVVLERPSRDAKYNLVWPELPPRSDSATLSL
jgi:hypothetical protein